MTRTPTRIQIEGWQSGPEGRIPAAYELDSCWESVVFVRQGGGQTGEALLHEGEPGWVWIRARSVHPHTLIPPLHRFQLSIRSLQSRRSRAQWLACSSHCSER